MSKKIYAFTAKFCALLCGVILTGAVVFGDDLPGDPVPDDPIPPRYDDTELFIRPAPDLALRGAYKGIGDVSGYNHGGGIQAMLLLEAGRIGLMVQGGVSGAQEHPYYADVEIEARGRYRIPIDPRHIFWTGLGADISARHASNKHLDSFVNIQPLAFIGTMFAVGNGKCVFHIFAKAMLAVWDNRTQSDRKWDASFDTFLRPGVGGEALASCGDLQVVGDYQHIFSLSHGGDVNKASLQSSFLFPIDEDGSLRIGPYLRGEVLDERGAAYEGLDPMSPARESKTMGGVFTGLEIRF